jgi:hypothetical protein
MTTSNPIRGIAAAIAGLALCAFGAAAQAAEITLYEHADFGGAQLTLRGWTPSIGATGFNDRASSVVVASGRWELCSDADFKGTCSVFTRGEYPTLPGNLNDRISSARELGSYGDRRGGYNDYGRGELQLFAGPEFQGRSLTLQGDSPSLSRSDFNDRATSVVVTRGTWELCFDDNYGGECRFFSPGSYPDLGYGTAGKISSARLVRAVNEAPAVISPGVPPGPVAGARAVLFTERGLRGTSLAVAGPLPDLDRANFNDAAASLLVQSGTWVACRDSFFRGDCRSFGPGRYDDLGAAGLDRAISSIRPGGEMPRPGGPVGGPVPGPAAGVELFAQRDFGGQRIGIDGSAPEMPGFNDRARSIIVHAGTWEMCTDARFGGSCAVFRPGRYPDLGGLAGQISSARRIQ